MKRYDLHESGCMHEAANGKYCHVSEVNATMIPRLDPEEVRNLLIEYRNCAVSAAIQLTNGNMTEFTKHSDKELRAKAALFKLMGVE